MERSYVIFDPRYFLLPEHVFLFSLFKISVKVPVVVSATPPSVVIRPKTQISPQKAHAHQRYDHGDGGLEFGDVVMKIKKKMQ